MLNVAYPFYFTIFQREMNCYVKGKKANASLWQDTAQNKNHIL